MLAVLFTVFAVQVQSYPVSTMLAAVFAARLPVDR